MTPQDIEKISKRIEEWKQVQNTAALSITRSVCEFRIEELQWVMDNCGKDESLRELLIGFGNYPVNRNCEKWIDEWMKENIKTD